MVKRTGIINSKRGWIRIIEVFVSIMLLTGILLVVINPGYSQKNNLQKEISSKENAILRDIELNSEMRTQILSIPIGTLPLEWEEFSDELPEVRDRIVYLAPKNLDCRAKVCTYDDTCLITGISGEIYAEAVLFSADASTYSPRQLKIFCIKND